MNYIRGAVNAISVPYQYYRDLNPSTLTGAIDVIVIRRPKIPQEFENAEEPPEPPNGESELVCSPFHVRFGKWQVLRPADKKVDVFVNGNLVPIPMKIGEAGEAFFVFETDEDVPESLVTSPVLAPTEPAEPEKQPTSGRFGAKEEGPTTPLQARAEVAPEPEFLDLDATAERPSELTETRSTPGETQQEKPGPGIYNRVADAGRAIAAATQELEQSSRDKFRDFSPGETLREAEKEGRNYVRGRLSGFSPASYLRYGTGQVNGSKVDESKVDEILPDIRDKTEPPTVRYTDDMVFDMEGYHSRGQSEGTLKDGDQELSVGTRTAEGTPGQSRSPSPEPSASSSYSGGPIPFPPFRAKSEPPPDMDHITLGLPSQSPDSPQSRLAERHAMKISVTEEYSWEWGNFPQKTPVRAAFGAPVSSSAKGKERMRPDDMELSELGPTRSPLNRSVTDGDRKREPSESGYGSGGLLTVDRQDPTRFRVFLEGRAMEFELSIIPSDSRDGSYFRDDFEDARTFEAGKVDFQRFLEDEDVTRNEHLVLRWAGDKYITRQDGSPLMDALNLWREGALRSKGTQTSSRPVSPQRSSDTELSEPLPFDSRPSEKPATTNGVEQLPPMTKKPSSSSWARWWNRRRDSEPSRPDLRASSSAPPDVQKGEPPRPDDLLVPIQKDRLVSTSSSPLPSSPEPMSPPAPPTEPEVPPKPRKRYAKTLRLTSDQLKSLDLQPGANTVTFSLASTGIVACTAKLFVWEYTDQIVVSDIDGTITKSDALGHVFTMIGRDWTHSGVAKLYTDIYRNGYKIMYLTSRAIGQADSTRDYLKGIKQNDYQLPEGPVIMSPDRLMASLHREVIMRKPEVFKMACLRDIQRLFGPYAKKPFYAGFGNRITDALSYRSVNIPSSRIFTIDSTGEVKMELLELAGYKSSYIHMTDLVDQMFPPMHRKWANDYTDFNYWKQPVQQYALPDLSPPSPALSARSDASNSGALARLRNFSLVSSRQSTKHYALPPPVAEANGRDIAAETRKDAHLRQMSSLERLSSTIASFTQSSSTVASPRSTTPTYIDTEDEDEEDDKLEKGRYDRRRTRSMSSMPGSLPGSSGSDDEMQFEVDNASADEYQYEGDQEPGEDTFDEDLLAAGEMKDVPFL